MRFETTLLLVGNNTGIDVPPAVLDELGGGKRPLVNVTVNDSYSYRSAVAPMGGRYLISFSSDKRAATGLKGGETITVELTVDTEPRTVEVPDDLAAALSAAGLRAAFDRISPSQQKAHVTSVVGAKTAETRARRVAAIVEKLS
jgi:Bacteriocin-protection, YdeI or OmpD-Associated/Domain of unknown function (DUF1905)